MTAITIVRRSTPTEALARDAGVHPDLVRALVRSGFIARDESPARLASAMRLRRDLGVNVAGALLACDLLERIETLEARWIPSS
jgi:chaperone modulatory protein CbpM